ncbi:MAG: metallopeptidase family protein [Proteobacteria bacterium]|nr:metallopeptidase family protein [Pseudomonadota bacterium]MCZ6782298.1 metallopeptidase family protein [Pseudomonadota bacterium]
MKDKDRYWDCLDQAMEASHGGRTDEAMAWLEEALRAHPEGAEAHNGRGEILWDEDAVDDALREFEKAIAADPKFTAAHLNRAEILIEELGEFEHVLEVCDELLAGRPELPRPDRSLQAEIYYLKSKALFYLDDLGGALFLVRRAIKAGGDQPVYRAFEGQILFELGRYEEARRVLEHAVALDSESPHAVYHFALAQERAGDPEEAQRAFAQANSLDPQHYPLPEVVDDEVFRGAVSEALANLPRSIRDYVENVPVLVEDFPSVEMVESENVSPQILGIFVGVPRTEASVSSQPPDLDRVMIFKRNLEKICSDSEELIEQIQITVRHEIGHYLGLDEDDMERLGLA